MILKWYNKLYGLKETFTMSNHQCTEKNDMLFLHKIGILLVALMLLYTYLTAKITSVIVMEEPTFNLRYADDAVQNNTELEDSYNQLVDIKNFSFLMNPQPCKNYTTGLLMVVIVASKPTNYENRMMIRKTWGHSTDYMKVVFLMGDSDNANITLKIDEENSIYNDIVQGSFIDAYRNMTYKHVMGLKWIAHHCPMAKYILKTDDDVFVNIKALNTFLIRELSPWGAKGLIACQLLEHAPVQRRDSKWIVTVEEYSLIEYPSYCAGWAVLYSQDVVQSLIKASMETPYFWIDDVHVTGTLAQKIGVPRSPLNKFILPRNKISILTKLGPRYVNDFLFGPHDLSLDNIRLMWEAISE